MKFKFRRLCLLALAAGMAFASGAQAQTTLQFNRWLPPGHFLQTGVLEEWAKDVEKATEGRVKIQVTASSLGPPPRQYDLVRQGVAGIAWGVPGYTPGRFLTTEGVELPFLGNSAEAMSVAFWRTYKKHFEQAGEFKDVKLLTLHTHTPGELFSNTKPLKTLDNIKGMKIRIINPATAEMTEALGGVAVSAPSSKAYELLSKGVVDATFLTADAVPQFKLMDYVNHQMEVEGGFFNAAFFLVMNKKVWDGLSKADQAAIEKLSGETLAARAGRAWDNQRAIGQKELEAKGVTTVEVTGAELEALKKKVAEVEQNWIEAVSKKGVDGKAALEMIRTEAAHYRAN